MTVGYFGTVLVAPKCRYFEQLLRRVSSNVCGEGILRQNVVFSFLVLNLYGLKALSCLRRDIKNHIYQIRSFGLAEMYIHNIYLEMSHGL